MRVSQCTFRYLKGSGNRIHFKSKLMVEHKAYLEVLGLTMCFILNSEMKSTIKFYRCDSHFLLHLVAKHIKACNPIRNCFFSDPRKIYHFIYLGLQFGSSLVMSW